MKFFKYFTREKIVPKNRIEKLLEKDLKDLRNISWDEYLQRFETTYPLELFITDYFPDNIYHQGPLEYDENIYGENFLNINNRYVVKKFNHMPLIKYGIYGKTDVSFLSKQNFLNTGVKIMIAHKRIIDVLNQNCPNDFQAIPMKIINMHKKSEPYEVDDFYMINVIRCIRALDIRKTKIKEWDDCTPYIKDYGLRYKKDPWSDSVRWLDESDPQYVKRKNHHIPDDKDYEIHKNAKPCMLAIDSIECAVVWHPKLAKQIPIDKSYYFRRGEEDPC